MVSKVRTKYIEMKRIIVGHPYWGRGGAEIAAMWVLQSLIKDYLIDVVTRGGWNLDELNRAAGTSIPVEAIRLRHPPFSTSSVAGAIWLGFFYRYCRKIAPDYDLCITASRVIDWGKPAIHMLSDVAWNRRLQERFKTAEYYRRQGLISWIYWASSDFISGKSGRQPEQYDLFIANSRWTASSSQEFCKQTINVIYPPVSTFNQTVSWEGRENAFICLGRISSEKNIEQAIHIIEVVRECIPDMELYLVGEFVNDLYSKKIQKLCDLKKWIKVTGPLYGDEKNILLANCRYGINTCTREAFGIATAEMVRAGVIPFVPLEGAQSEILQNSDLCYKTEAEAVEKINHIVLSVENQKRSLDHLHRISDGLGVEKFCEKLSEVVSNWFEEQEALSTKC